MVKYSPRAARALSFLKRSYNDIDVFVEDTGNHNMWLLLLRRMLPARIKLTSVNLLGGRNMVMEACRLDQADNARKKLYIVDGDFDFLHGTKKVNLRHLYRVRAYCIENLLISEESIVRAAVPLQPTKIEADLIRDLDFARWYSATNKLLEPLFVVYAVVRLLKPSIQTVSYSVQSLLKSGPGGPLICEKKIARRIRALLRELRSDFSLERIRQERRVIAARAKSLNVEQAISGKDYLLPLVWLRMKLCFGFRGTFEQLKVVLAQFWSPLREGFFNRRLLTVAGA